MPSNGIGFAVYTTGMQWQTPMAMLSKLIMFMATCRLGDRNYTTTRKPRLKKGIQQLICKTVRTAITSFFSAIASRACLALPFPISGTLLLSWQSTGSAGSLIGGRGKKEKENVFAARGDNLKGFDFSLFSIQEMSIEEENPSVC